MKHGLIQITALSPDVIVGDPKANARVIAAGIHRYAREGSRILITPELSLTGVTVGDLIKQDVLLSACEQALADLLVSTQDEDIICIVGVPITVDGCLYDAAAVIKNGAILGVVAKRILSIAQARCFTSAPDAIQTISLCGQEVPFGGTQVFACTDVPNLVIGVEFGEEAMNVHAPHGILAECGATVICNIAGTNTICGRDASQKQSELVLSSVCQSAYVYVDARGESTTDYVYGGQKIVAQCGEILAESSPFAADALTSVIDVGKVAYERKCRRTLGRSNVGVQIDFGYNQLTETELGSVSPYPFVPSDPIVQARLAEQTILLQAQGLATRAKRIGAKRYVIGVSGGLDSTLALLVCKKACEIDHLVPRESIICVTLPCFGTTSRTKNNAQTLCDALGLSCREINIAAAVTQHLKDIGHSLDEHDAAFENAQARMRTMVLMDIANSEGGIVVGTGDLSELALGWCTYNGDHMCMYGVNGTVPKTLIQCIIKQVAACSDNALRAVLEDILATPISPELLPTVDGQIAQKTEEIVGKYEINDFILYHTLRAGMEPSKLFRYALAAFPHADKHSLKDAFVRFYKRFFSQQFKRSCSPDGAKVGEIDLSPRGEWQMPSDVTPAAWLADLDNI